MAMALVPAVLTLNVSPCSFSVAVDTCPTRAPGAKAAGRGSSARTRPAVCGFARLYLPPTKVPHGFATGDLVLAVAPPRNLAVVYVGRAAVCSRGSFNIKSDTHF